ncbi:MAG: spore coat protein [Firmicutes bacterium]|jgi:DNA primase|nr:spore coat protein [Bacillota bacterium]
MSTGLTDKDILSSGLLAVKHMAMLYNDVASHTDDPKLVQEMSEMINEEHHARIRVFEAMRQRGWYNPKPIDQQQLQQAQQQLMSNQEQQSWDAIPQSPVWQQQPNSPQQPHPWQAQTNWPAMTQNVNRP